MRKVNITNVKKLTAAGRTLNKRDYDVEAVFSDKM